MAIATKIGSFMERSSWIRRMFEAGSALKAAHGEETSCRSGTARRWQERSVRPLGEALGRGYEPCSPPAIPTNSTAWYSAVSVPEVVFDRSCSIRSCPNPRHESPGPT